MTTARGAPRAAIRTPALAGPVISATASVVSSLALPSTRRRRPISVGRYATSVIWNSALAAPTPAPTTTTWIIESRPRPQATVREATSAARIRSAAMRMRRLRLRSTKPPASMARMTPGASCIAARTPITASGWSRVATAMIGSAVRVIREPKALIACAAHRRRKSAWFQRSRSVGGGLGGGDVVMTGAAASARVEDERGLDVRRAAGEPRALEDAGDAPVERGDGRWLKRPRAGDLAGLVDVDLVEERTVERLAAPRRRAEAGIERRRVGAHDAADLLEAQAPGALGRGRRRDRRDSKARTRERDSHRPTLCVRPAARNRTVLVCAGASTTPVSYTHLTL